MPWSLGNPSCLPVRVALRRRLCSHCLKNTCWSIVYLRFADLSLQAAACSAGLLLIGCSLNLLSPHAEVQVQYKRVSQRTKCHVFHFHLRSNIMTGTSELSIEGLISDVDLWIFSTQTVCPFVFNFQPIQLATSIYLATDVGDEY